MFTCKEIAKLLDLYSDGELDERQRHRVETHLRDCAACSQLVRFRKDEAWQIRSSDPVPALSPGFTRQVMTCLIPTGYSRVQREGFVALRSMFTRPWFAPALAGLMLLATASWATSRHLIITSPGQVASKSQIQATPATPTMPQTQAYSDNDSLTLKDNLMEGKTIQGSPTIKEDAQTSSSRAIAPSSPENRITTAASPKAANPPAVEVPEAAGTPDAKAPMLRTLSLAPQQKQNNLDTLEQQGHTVFKPDYLPPGYSFTDYTLQPLSMEGSDNTQDPAPPSGKNSLLLTYSNTRTGEQITLEILPLNSLAPAPDAATNVPDNQQTVANQITRYAQKHGNNFMLRVTGSIPYGELMNVMKSVK